MSLAAFYSSDLNGEEMSIEVDDLSYFLRNNPDPPKSAKDLISLCHTVKICPNLRIAMRLLQTIGTSVASCERSFSKLKLLKNYLRATMGQERLNSLALLSIEKCNLNTIVERFMNMKVRRLNV